MNVPHVFLKNFIPVLENHPFFEGVTITSAYENDIKPYPVETPIIALSVKNHTVGDRQIEVDADGSQTVSNNRIGETVFKACIFVPYEDGPAAAYRWADGLYSYILFETTLKVTGCRIYECNYIRECGALMLNTDFTLRQTLSE